jgi:hypothetical protein
LLIGYFEGLDAERAIAWHAADSFALREFLGLELPEAPPDHSTISRTRRLIDLETHEAVFTWILQRLADAGLVKGKTIGIDATTLEANAALRSIVRRDTGATYQAFLTQLAQASGIDTPIQPYAKHGPHDVRNGVLLRADLHRLFDQGYVTITPEYRLEVSPRLKEDYQNGRSYYPLHGSSVSLPSTAADAPSVDFLRWHNERVYRAV